MKFQLKSRKKRKKKFQFYENLREKFAKKINLDKKNLSLKDYLFLLPDFFMLSFRLTVDKRVDLSTKVIAAAIVAYVMMPIDFIPDFIPVIGYIDDLVIVAVGLNKIFKDIPQNILLENWSGQEDMLLQIQNIISKAESTLSKKVFKKIKNFFNNVKNEGKNNSKK